MSNLYVFDTNVIISAALFASSKPGVALNVALDRGKVLISLAVISELNDVLSRPKFERYVPLEKRERFLAVLCRDAILVEIVERVEECRDPKDDKFLELAVNGNATAIVSGDRDLLVLHPFREIPIITPDEFLSLYSSGV